MKVSTLILINLCIALSVFGESERPNVILMIADDLGYGETSVQGNKEIPTPHIDSIALEGVRFTAGYVTSPYCSASRAGLMSGRYPNRFGYEFNPIGADNEHPQAGIPASEDLLPEILETHGYATGLVGKWHLGGAAHFHPNRHGFGYFYGFTHEGHYFVPPPYEGVVTMLRKKALPNGQKGRWISKDESLVLSTHMGHMEPDYDANNPIVRQGQPVEEKRHLTDAITDESISFIKRNADRPFFLTVSYNAVHSPLQGADKYMEKFASIQDIHRRIFAAMLSHMDDSVGAILKTVEESGIQENTIIIFLSDNGGPTKELTSSNKPLNGGKGTMFEGGVRVPFFLKWPKKIKVPQIVDSPISALDILPSIVQATGIQFDPKNPLDGINWWPHLELPENSELLNNRVLFWKLGPRYALRHANWKIVKHPNSKWQLFNLNNDAEEKSDLTSAFPDLQLELVKKWHALQSEMKPPIWSRNR